MIRPHPREGAEIIRWGQRFSARKYSSESDSPVEGGARLRDERGSVRSGVRGCIRQGEQRGGALSSSSGTCSLGRARETARAFTFLRRGGPRMQAGSPHRDMGCVCWKGRGAGLPVIVVSLLTWSGTSRAPGVGLSPSASHREPPVQSGLGAQRWPRWRGSAHKFDRFDHFGVWRVRPACPLQ
jgi:hypothetical protein